MRVSLRQIARIHSATRRGASGRAPGVAILALGILLVSQGCASTPRLEPDHDFLQEDTDPSWRWMPLSWEKLDAIETWLVGPGPRTHPEMVAEAELLLAEGRAQFAHDESQGVDPSVLHTRVAAAEAGYRRVLSDPFASEAIKSRARRGLSSLQGVRSSEVAADVPGVQSRASWGARAPNRRRLTPSTGRWWRITVHHSAIDSGGLLGASVQESAQAVAGIQREHMDSNGWGDIGYHYLIDPRGHVFAGRSLQWQGAHAGGVNGANNVGNIGICLLGNFDEERPTRQALHSLEGLIGDLRRRFGIPASEVHGHQEFKTTDCPGRYLEPWVVAYRHNGESYASAR